jgi:hypothetical protein
MNDVDLLVRASELAPARETIERLGWSIAQLEPESRLRHLHGAAFRREDAPEIDLHTRALAESAAPGADDPLFERAVSFDVDGVSARTLSPEDHLLVVCVHGLRWSAAPAIHWVADAALLLRRFPAMDWATTLDETARRGLEAPLLLALRFLRDEFGANVPASIVETLSDRASTGPRRDAAVRMSRPTLAGGLRLHWRQLAQEQPGLGPFRRLGALPAHLKEMWALDHGWQVPVVFVRKSLRRITRSR